MSDESLRGSIVNLNDLIKVLNLLHSNGEHISVVLEKLGSDYLQKLLKTSDDLDKLKSDAFLLSHGNVYDVLSLARPNELVKMCEEQGKFSKTVNLHFLKSKTPSRFLQSLSDEDFRKVINSQTDFLTLLVHIGTADKDNILKYCDRLGQAHLKKILDKNFLKVLDIIFNNGLTDKAVEQLETMRQSRQYGDILKIFEEQPSSCLKCRM